MQPATKEELFAPYLGLFSGSDTACLDNRFCVVSCDNGILEPGESVLQSLREVVPEPLGTMMDTTLYKKERFFCFRIHPIKNDIGESIAYIGEFIGADGARSIIERTEGPSDILPLYNAVETNSAQIWDKLSEIRYDFIKRREYDRMSPVIAMESAVTAIAAVCSNAFHYAEMLYCTQRETVVDAGTLCEELGQRCNAALAKCGRHIEVMTEPGRLNIYADSRRAVVALVNAIQNALLYSPRESEPVLTVCYRESRGRKFVEIRLVNESSMFTSRDFSDGTEVNFSYQRLGYGIPIIKRFAQVSGGWFDMSEDNGKVTVTISLPAAYTDGSEIPLRSPGGARYDAGVPDITDIMMYEVVRFFGGDASIHR